MIRHGERVTLEGRSDTAACGVADQFRPCLKTRRAVAGRECPICFVVAPQRLIRLSRFVAGAIASGAFPTRRGSDEFFRQGLAATPFVGGWMQLIRDAATAVSAHRANERTPMKYMLLVYMDEKAMNESEREQCYKDSTQLVHQLHAKGQLLGANPLQSVATATSLRLREGKRLVTDGPFAETREQLGGYFLIDAPDLDAAIDIAARIPPSRKGTIEIRPVVELAGLPKV